MTDYLKQLLRNLRRLRKGANLSREQLEDRLILGQGWIKRFEEGKTVPSLNMLLAILHETASSLDMLIPEQPPASRPTDIERSILAEQHGKDIVLRFPYATFDAAYTLQHASVDEFNTVVKTLRNGLAKLGDIHADNDRAIKTDSVARAFLTAVNIWPHANPSDLWWFIIYRAYCDPFNHPAEFARLDFTQSWKRTAGWALEEVLVRHYGPFLRRYGIHLFIAEGEEKKALVNNIDVDDRLEADKVDVVLLGGKDKGFFGVVNVKASFAERRTDDVPMSTALARAGYTSPLWTMDCKSMPAAKPLNRGELGDTQGRRSAKRKDIEDEGYFTGCFSYNTNTQPSKNHVAPERRIYVCDFQGPDDEFSLFIRERWQQYQHV